MRLVLLHICINNEKVPHLSNLYLPLWPEKFFSFLFYIHLFWVLIETHSTISYWLLLFWKSAIDKLTLPHCHFSLSWILLFRPQVSLCDILTHIQLFRGLSTSDPWLISFLFIPPWLAGKRTWKWGWCWLWSYTASWLQTSKSGHTPQTVPDYNRADFLQLSHNVSKPIATDFLYCCLNIKMCCLLRHLYFCSSKLEIELKGVIDYPCICECPCLTINKDSHCL